MNTSCPTAPLSTTTAALPTPTRASRGLFASLERIINTAGFVSVDLTDTVFVSLHVEREREREKARGHINYLE
jgi:hypothetical protein